MWSVFLAAGIFLVDAGVGEVRAGKNTAPSEAFEQLQQTRPSDLGAHAFTLQTMPFFLERGGEKAAGKLLPATQLDIKAKDGEWLHVTARGWQEGGGTVIYGVKGQRILTAIMAKQAVGHASVGEPEVEESTGQTWMPVSLDVWLPAQNVAADIAPVWAYASTLYQNDCGTCHTAHAPGHFTANQWIGQLKSMERFSQLDKEQNRLVLKFLQYHAKDSANASGH